MAADLPGTDPKALWRDQEQESDPVTLDQIHTMVRRYDSRAQRAAVVIPAILLLVGFVGGVTWIRANDLAGHVMAVALVLGEATTFFIVRRMLYLPRDPAEPAGVYLHRRLLRRLAYLKGRWMIAVAPLVPAMVLAQYFVLTHGHRSLLLRASPTLIVIAAIVLVRLLGRDRTRKVRALIDELEGLMRR